MRKSEQRARAEGRASVGPRATVETAIAVEHLSLGVVDGGLILAFEPRDAEAATAPATARMVIDLAAVTALDGETADDLAALTRLLTTALDLASPAAQASTPPSSQSPVSSDRPSAAIQSSHASICASDQPAGASTGRTPASRSTTRCSIATRSARAAKAD